MGASQGSVADVFDTAVKFMKRRNEKAKENAEASRHSAAQQVLQYAPFGLENSYNRCCSCWLPLLPMCLVVPRETCGALVQIIPDGSVWMMKQVSLDRGLHPCLLTVSSGDSSLAITGWRLRIQRGHRTPLWLTCT